MKKTMLLILTLVLTFSICACSENDYTTGNVNSSQPSSIPQNAAENGTEGLDYYPLANGTYGVKAGKTLYLSEIVIPSTFEGKDVTQILPNAFENATNLVSITLPDTVREIGAAAFSGCSSLVEVTLPDGVTEIGAAAFSGCSSLVEVTLPDGVTEIGDSIFRGCTGLTSIVIPDGVTSIGDGAFLGCRGLTSVTIPDGVTSIGSSVFRDCSSLTTITIPEGMLISDSSAFDYCSDLTDVYYTGTKEQWKFNGSMLSCAQGVGGYTVHCTDGKIEN